MKRKCTHCGSDELLEGLRVADRGENNHRAPLEVEMDTKPDAIFFRGTASTPVTASMCCICGHVLLFADPDFASDLQELEKLKNETSKDGVSVKHPLYKQFLKDDPANKFYEPSHQAMAFAKWLRKHGHDEQ